MIKYIYIKLRGKKPTIEVEERTPVIKNQQFHGTHEKLHSAEIVLVIEPNSETRIIKNTWGRHFVDSELKSISN